jgi:hypothetical protein
MEPALSTSLNGQGLQLPPSNDADNVKNSNEKKGAIKKRKKSGQKASNKPSKRSRGKNKTLKPPVAVVGAVSVNASDHAGVQTDVGKGVKKTGKKRAKNHKPKSVAVLGNKKKRQPAKSSKTKGACDLKPPLDATADNALGEKGRQGFDSPRKGDKRGDFGEFGGSEAEMIYEKIAHDGHGGLQKEPQGEVAEEHVPVVVEVGQSTLINWEHFSLVYEEYCLTKEVNRKP